MLALLCSGQGKQSRTMFDLFAHTSGTEPVFAAATDVLGQDPRGFVGQADDPALHGNRVSQMLNVTRALAAQHCLAPALPPNLLIAGYSVGEMAAWGIAGVWSVADTLRLTARRAELMDQVSESDDVLGFVRGLSHDTIESMAAQSGCAIAIINPGQLFIVGGAREQVARLCCDALRAGATQSGLLPVHVASHTPRLKRAVEPFEHALRAVKPQRIASRCKLLSGAHAQAVFRPEDALRGLASQLACTIDWNAVVSALIEEGVDTMLELGPGSALADMIHAAYPSIRVRSLDDFRSLDSAKDWLRA